MGEAGRPGDASLLSDQARAHVWVSGRVQGVFFRATTAERARATGVDGWVRNVPDGRVEAVFQGPRASVEEMVEWCHLGPEYARVDSVEVQWESWGGDLDGFGPIPHGS